MSRRRKTLNPQPLAPLQGERLTLRVPQLADAKAVYAYASDSEVTRFLAWPRHTSLADSEHFLHEAVTGWLNGKHLVWLIEDEAGVAGAIGAVPSGANVGIGYVLRRDRWGRGYATEALRLVADALLGDTPVAAIWALCVTENIASQRVLEKSGFHLERTMRHYFSCPNLGGEKQDVWLYTRGR